MLMQPVACSLKLTGYDVEFLCLFAYGETEQLRYHRKGIPQPTVLVAFGQRFHDLRNLRLALLKEALRPLGHLDCLDVSPRQLVELRTCVLTPPSEACNLYASFPT
ncbi:hypothetical protein D7044_29315 [Micromonospora musae]|uniref:Uncharacterized protein n=1 Tax=Micromonospora musae TaxID=1894970 RepID=A0A3A9XP52_9ACTN|nr:hypothetical protein D7044_29315 [Micromonospora musae]